MRIDRSYCSNQNTWPENHPQCIVVHNTDNFAAGADARALRSKPDSGKSSAEPDGQRGWTASSAADRDGAAEPGAPGKGYERFWNQTGLS